eukprot:13650-Pelagomonas_calceolata.AAC.1
MSVVGNGGVPLWFFFQGCRVQFYHQVVAYTSSNFSSAEFNDGTPEQELLALERAGCERRGHAPVVFDADGWAP